MIGASAKVTFSDKGLKALLEKVRASGKHALEVGVFDGGPELALIASVHEFGAPEANIPQRSYLRSTMLEGQKRYGSLLKSLLKSWQEGELTLEAALYRLSVTIVGDVQKRILRGELPDREGTIHPLKPATVASKQRRGLARPGIALYATGRLYNAIKARVT